MVNSCALTEEACNKKLTVTKTRMTQSHDCFTAVRTLQGVFAGTSVCKTKKKEHSLNTAHVQTRRAQSRSVKM